MKAKLVVSLVAAVAITLLSPAIASASHPRPKGATPVVASLVPAFGTCILPNVVHGPPLTVGACVPTGQTSTHVTIGTPDSNGAPAKSVGSFRLDVAMGIPGPPDDSDVPARVMITDIRCRSSNTTCGAANQAAGPDYTGSLEASFVIRVTDAYTGPSLTDHGTMTDLPFPIDFPCTETADDTVGATCATLTSLNGVVPGVIKDGKTAVWEMGRVKIYDGGDDGVGSTQADNDLFAGQGLFIP
jgi:hypothetical protein